MRYRRLTKTLAPEREHRGMAPLAEGICDSIAADSGAAPLTEPQRAELKKRIAEEDAHPHHVIPWEEVKASTLARLRK